MTAGTRLVLAAFALSLAAVLAALAVAAYAGVSNASRVGDVRRLVVELRHVVADVQTSRFDGAVRSCGSRSQDRAQLVRFVSRLDPRLHDVAAAALPPIARDCRAYARATTRIH